MADRATIANMAPEYGATMGFFPVDDESVELSARHRPQRRAVRCFENYFRAQEMFGMPRKGEIDYSVDLELDLAEVQPSVAGPKRPQDRINLAGTWKRLSVRCSKSRSRMAATVKRTDDLGKQHFVQSERHAAAATATWPSTDKRRIKGIEPGEELNKRRKWSRIARRPTRRARLQQTPRRTFQHGHSQIGHGSVLIAAITSCTNTSNPSVMLAAGLLAKKAVERGLRVDPAVKTSLAPGSRVVTDYLKKTGLQTYLDQLGFNIVGYGCTTCIGNSGPLHPKIEKAINKYDLVAASVLSGNRNFEARVHQNIKANFLMSPPLVVAFALAGRVDLDLTKDPIGQGRDGEKFFCAISGRPCRRCAMRCNPRSSRKFSASFTATSPIKIRSGTKSLRAPAKSIEWDEKSDYIHEPPFFAEFRDGSRDRSTRFTARGRSAFSATPSRPITFRRRARSSDFARRVNI